MERYILASLERMFGKKKQTTFVYYKCSKCGHESKWDFDTPCPILLEED